MKTRRDFLTDAGLLLGATLLRSQAAPKPREAFVQTVLGPVPISRFGKTLVHEHVICDFIGADQTGRQRWKVESVVDRMQPILLDLKKRGFSGLVDCTPAYIGRDPRILKTLAKNTQLHLLTNTGYYGGAGDKYVPKHAYVETPERLAERWVDEWGLGIEETGVKPGFVKTGVDEINAGTSKLSAIDEKLVRATAWTSRQTGLTVTCHTGGGAAGLAAANLFIREGGEPGRFIVAHSDGHGLAINKQVADLGVWVSFDAISRRPLAEHLKLVRTMLEKHSDRLLLSHDNGWYNVGTEGGGKIRDFNYLPDVFLPALEQAQVSAAIIRKVVLENPARAFGMQAKA